MPRMNFLKKELEDISNVHYLMAKRIPTKFTLKRENFKREEMQVIPFLNIYLKFMNG